MPLEVRQLPSLEHFQHALSQISVSSLLCLDVGFLSIILCLHRDFYLFIHFFYEHFAELSALEVQHSNRVYFILGGRKKMMTTPVHTSTKAMLLDIYIYVVVVIEFTEKRVILH